MRRPSSRAIVRSTTDGATAVSSKQANGPRPPILIPTTTWFATRSNGTAIRVTLDVRLTRLGPADGSSYVHSPAPVFGEMVETQSWASGTVTVMEPVRSDVDCVARSLSDPSAFELIFDRHYGS